jgi:hypothetical protein
MEAVTRQKRHIVSAQRKIVVRQAFIRITGRNIVGIRLQNPDRDIKVVPAVRDVIRKYKRADVKTVTELAFALPD